MRRKKTKKGGGIDPRVTRNITEEEVLRRIADLCSTEHPDEKYDRGGEVGAGASGTVFTATDKRSGDRVAIKIIDLQKQVSFVYFYCLLFVHICLLSSVYSRGRR